MVGNLLFFVYWILDEVRSIKEVQKTSRSFWIYISIFTQPIWFIHVFQFFSFYCNIYNVTNPIIDVYEVNNGRHYHCQSNVRAYMNIMRRRSIFKNINGLTMIWFTTRLTYINLPQFIRKDDLNIPIKTIKSSQSNHAISHISMIAGSAA